MAPGKLNKRIIHLIHDYQVLRGVKGTLPSIFIREIVIVENIRLVRLLTANCLLADFGVKTNAKLLPIFKLREKNKTGIQSCLYTVTMTP